MIKIQNNKYKEKTFEVKIIFFLLHYNIQHFIKIDRINYLKKAIVLKN